MSGLEWTGIDERSFSERDATLLQRAVETLTGNVLHQEGPLPWHPYRGICPARDKYPGIWNWDAAFHAIAVGRWDMELARDQARILFSYQMPTGQFPDVIRLSGDVLTTIGKPPVLAWACEQMDRRAPDETFLKLSYASLARNARFWLAARGGQAMGLYHYDSAAPDPTQRAVEARWESGWDNSVRWDETIVDLWPIDLNCYMVMCFRALSYLAGRLGQHADVAEWELQERELIRTINRVMWSDRSGAYVDVLRHDGRLSTVLSPASFMPLFIGIATPERADALARLAASPEHFYPGMPTVAYGDPGYASTDFWRGPTWLNTSYFALKGLRNCGHDSLAMDMRERLLDWCAAETSIFEHYDSRTGKGLGATQFGWSAAFIIELILGFGSDTSDVSA
jgi:putative isomerase